MSYQYQFLGPLGLLKELVARKGFSGSWRYQRLCTGGTKHTFKGDDGAILNFWESSNTVTFQGADQAKEILLTSIKSCLREKERDKPGQNKDIC